MSLSTLNSKSSRNEEEAFRINWNNVGHSSITRSPSLQNLVFQPEFGGGKHVTQSMWTRRVTKLSELGLDFPAQSFMFGVEENGFRPIPMPHSVEFMTGFFRAHGIEAGEVRVLYVVMGIHIKNRLAKIAAAEDEKK